MGRLRPLRLSREEDWSDWLAWLLETSTTGILAQAVFGPHIRGLDISTPPSTVTREVHTCLRERRADLVLSWREELAIHLEVKVGDRQLEKTFETAARLTAHKPHSTWRHFILLPDRDLGPWSRALEASAGSELVTALVWSDVARSLRRCLWATRERVAWRTWAWTFCGAIEQTILGLRDPATISSQAVRLQMALRWRDILCEEPGGIR